MGYSEVPCHLCGVSFNIARLRTVDEPPEAAWRSADWSASEGTFVSHQYGTWNACTSEENGCRVALRTERNPNVTYTRAPQVIPPDFLESYEEEEDEDYEFESESDTDDEILEYDSDAESSASDIEMSDAPEGTEPLYCEDYISLVQDVVDNYAFEPAPPAPERFFEIEQKENFEGELWKREEASYGVVKPYQDINLVGVEHVAGPTCKEDRGYNGHFVTAAEMRGCTTYQMLARKERNWEKEEGDQTWEEEEDWFLTGIGDRFPSRDMASPSVLPVRHGWDEGETDVYGFHPQAATTTAMPFHPTCFNILTRLSNLHIGKVDIPGLINWRAHQYDRPGHMWPASLDPMVGKCNSQWWDHQLGSEYLAANPLYIPGLPSIVRSAVSEDEGFSTSNGAFSVTVRKNEGDVEDPFMKLPQELRLHIIDLLDSTSIASLRRSSRAFQQLPISLFYLLLRCEIPSLWEILPSTSPLQTQKPLIWTALDVLIMKREAKEREEYNTELQKIRHYLRSDLPEVIEEWSKNYPVYAGTDAWAEARCFMDEVEGKALSEEERGRINWYVLYTRISRERKKGGLKGLRNRERIWRDISLIVEEIVDVKEREVIVD